MGGKPDQIQVDMAKKLLGVDIRGKQNPVNIKELIAADKIIVVADDIPERMFDYQLVNLKKKLEIWGIKDEQKQSSKNIENIVNKIKKKVEELNGNC